MITTMTRRMTTNETGRRSFVVPRWRANRELRPPLSAQLHNYTMHSVQCTMHNVHATAHNTQYTIHTAQCSYTMHNVLLSARQLHNDVHNCHKIKLSHCTDLLLALYITLAAAAARLLFPLLNFDSGELTSGGYCRPCHQFHDAGDSGHCLPCNWFQHKFLSNETNFSIYTNR